MGFGSQNIQSTRLVIDVDPGSTGSFHLMRAPSDLTVVRASMVSKNTQNSGTASLCALQNWGTAGASIKAGAAGTVTATLGGTAVAAVLTANTPGTVAPTSAGKNLTEGEWLVVAYTEEGAGWISGDRYTFVVDYILGKA